MKKKNIIDYNDKSLYVTIISERDLKAERESHKHTSFYHTLTESGIMKSEKRLKREGYIQ